MEGAVNGACHSWETFSYVSLCWIWPKHNILPARGNTVNNGVFWGSWGSIGSMLFPVEDSVLKKTCALRDLKRNTRRSGCLHAAVGFLPSHQGVGCASSPNFNNGLGAALTCPWFSRKPLPLSSLFVPWNDRGVLLLSVFRCCTGLLRVSWEAVPAECLCPRLV